MYILTNLNFTKSNLKKIWQKFLDNIVKHLWKIFFAWIFSILVLLLITNENYDLLYSKYQIARYPLILVFQLFLVILVAPILPPILIYGMARRYIWGYRTSLVLGVLAIPMIMFWIIALFTLIYFFISINYLGAIESIDGARLWQNPVAPFPNWENLQNFDTPARQRYWSEYSGTKGLLNIGYFSSQVMLGLSYGEYQPIGLVKPFVVLEALIGKVLDIVLISIGLSILLGRQKKKKTINKKNQNNS